MHADPWPTADLLGEGLGGQAAAAYKAAMSALPFIKMHGLGNDFVVFDARTAPIRLTRAERHAMASRRTGIGCDQIITIEPSARADAFMRVHNADGGEVEACGNATRCVAARLMAEDGRDQVVIETLAGLLEARASGADVSVDMGEARHDWREIPLAEAADTLHLDLHVGSAETPDLADPVAVNIGNPHIVFFVADAEAIDVAQHGAALETAALFPERVNVSIVQVVSVEVLRVRVWERGVGITAACGTAACAAMVAAARRGLTGRGGEVRLDGGALRIDWREDGHVMMRGPVAVAFAGEIDPGALLGGSR